MYVGVIVAFWRQVSLGESVSREISWILRESFVRRWANSLAQVNISPGLRWGCTNARIVILCRWRCFKRQTIQFLRERRQRILHDPCKACAHPVLLRRNRRLLPNYKGTKTVVCGRHQTSSPFSSLLFLSSPFETWYNAIVQLKETFAALLFQLFFFSFTSSHAVFIYISLIRNWNSFDLFIYSFLSLSIRF